MCPEDQDDKSITDESLLYRRIPPHWVVPDGEGGLRISSQGFNDPQMSCNVGDCLDRSDYGPEDLLEAYPEFGLATITAALAREESQSVCYDPVDGEICHGLVLGRKNKRVSKKFAGAASDNVIAWPQNHGL